MKEKVERPDWMKDELVKDIPPQKLNFLEKMFAEGHGKSQKETLALLMPMLQKARRENLTFTPQEMSAAVSAIKKHSSAAELQQIDKIISKTQKGSL